MKKVKLFFAWYDFWVGVYYDRIANILYICPIPCCVFQINLWTIRPFTKEWHERNIT